jgi:hypothetical protein
VRPPAAETAATAAAAAAAAGALLLPLLLLLPLPMLLLLPLPMRLLLLLLMLLPLPMRLLLLMLMLPMLLLLPLPMRLLVLLLLLLHTLLLLLLLLLPLPIPLLLLMLLLLHCRLLLPLPMPLLQRTLLKLLMNMLLRLLLLLTPLRRYAQPSPPSNIHGGCGPHVPTPHAGSQTPTQPAGRLQPPDAEPNTAHLQLQIRHTAQTSPGVRGRPPRTTTPGQVPLLRGAAAGVNHGPSAPLAAARRPATPPSGRCGLSCGVWGHGAPPTAAAEDNQQEEPHSGRSHPLHPPAGTLGLTPSSVGGVRAAPA